MAEINLSELIMFDKGFAIETSTNLIIGTTYSLNISDGINNIIKQYVPVVSGNTIIDTWGSIIPSGGNVCMTLTDSTPSCSPLGCILTVSA